MVAQLGPSHGHRTNPGLDRALWAVAVSNHTCPAIRKPFVLHHGKKCLSFGLDRLRQKTASAIAQNTRQRILKRARMLKGKNGVIYRHGVSLLREVLAGFYPPRYAAFLKPSSPTFNVRIR
ncbi:MAG: hypothetical protein GY877_01660 [Hyphomicrobium sp.]|nr:hypothetical protein [Hyphomicrobium sp.]